MGSSVDFGDLIIELKDLTQELVSWKQHKNDDSLWWILIRQGGPIHGNIAHITIASTGHSADFGNDMTQARRLCAQFSNSTRACAAGGYEPTTDIIDFTTISSLSAGVDFGDLASSKYFQSGSSSSTRGVILKNNSENTIQFVTISTTGDAVDFGDSRVVGQALGVANNSTRIVIAEGGSPNLGNVISFITTATTGNAQDFGDLVGTNRRDGVGTSSPTRGVITHVDMTVVIIMMNRILLNWQQQAMQLILEIL